ncbi:porin [Tropicimonas sp. TH_r6]|uniref:porin n=1 Tax=Tropicimonas sp. TH_r6 TaxID=3082085 RepID=UPI00295416CF|nr:porin [Tropicimonas sp. TH_r6]MDV7144693.1 porin [Tropicimonas sp. TH_r6]
MKKVLLTSTALVAFAGAAAAEVSLSGWAEMGVIGGSDITSQFFNDVDVDFTLSGETDGGLTFGANVDLDEAGDNLGNETDDMGIDVFVSGEFGTVTLGDTDGALDWALTDPAGVGSPGTIADDETAHWGRQDTYLDGSYDGQILRYDYSYEDFGFAISIEQDDTSDYALDEQDRDAYDYLWAIGAKWSPELGAGLLKLGIGYQEGDFGEVGFGLTDQMVDDLSEIVADASEEDQDALSAIFGFRANSDEADELTVALGENTKVWGLSAAYEMDNGFSVGAVYSQWDGDNVEGDHWAIGAGYTFDAFTIHANYGEHSFEGDSGGELDTDGYGVALGYDLGGGLSILGGYGKSEYDIKVGDVDASDDFDTWSLGLSMSF